MLPKSPRRSSRYTATIGRQFSIGAPTRRMAQVYDGVPMLNWRPIVAV